MCGFAGGAAAAGAGGLAGQHQLRKLRASHHAGLTAEPERASPPYNSLIVSSIYPCNDYCVVFLMYVS